jgi:Kef-type K+ transport system membrane component KefB
MADIRMDLHAYIPSLGRFALALALTLTLPRVMGKLRLPGPIGFIIAGIILGPHGLTIIDPQGPVINFFANLGKLLLMFLAGFEIDSTEFSRAYKKSLLFGALTFSFPFFAGALVAHAYGFGFNASALVGAILGSHTLLALPVVKALGLMERQSVLVTIGATVFTDILSILILAICLPIHVSGFSVESLAQELVELAIFVPTVLLGLSWFARHLLQRFGSTPVARTTILLLLMATGAQMAEFIHLEGIIGAFLTGIAAKRALHETPTEGSIEVISNTLFIPAFFVAAGFLVDFRVFADTMIDHPFLVMGIVGSLFVGKFLAAWCAAHLFGYGRKDMLLMFSLSIPQVAATLAVALVAYAAKNPDGQRLIDEPVLNATIVLVIVTSALGLILSDRFGRNIASGTSKGRTEAVKGWFAIRANED